MLNSYFQSKIKYLFSSFLCFDCCATNSKTFQSNATWTTTSRITVIVKLSNLPNSRGYHIFLNRIHSIISHILKPFLNQLTLDQNQFALTNFLSNVIYLSEWTYHIGFQIISSGLLFKRGRNYLYYIYHISRRQCFIFGLSSDLLSWTKVNKVITNSTC